MTPGQKKLSSNAFRRSSFTVFNIVINCALILTIPCAQACCSQEPAPSHEESQPVQATQGEWLKAEILPGIQFAGDSSSLMNSVRERIDAGIRIVSVVRKLQSEDERLGSPPLNLYQLSIQRARAEFPEAVILSGTHLDFPTENSSFDCIILFPETVEEFETHRKFEEYFATQKLESSTLERVGKALKWLKENAAHNGLEPVVFSHSSQWLGESDSDLTQPVARLAGKSDLFIGFPVIPDMDREFSNRTSTAANAYNPREEAWNQLLKRQLKIFAAVSSTARSPNNNSRQPDTWIQTTEPTPNKVLRAIKAGRFFTAEGGVARNFELTIDVNGEGQSLRPGDETTLSVDTPVAATVKCNIPPEDLHGEANWLDSLELVCISQNGVERLTERTIQLNHSHHQWILKVPNGGIVVRACARRSLENGDEYVVYTNPIFIRAEFRPETLKVSENLPSISAIQIIGFLGTFLVLIAFSRFVLKSGRPMRLQGACRTIRSVDIRIEDQTDNLIDWMPPVVPVDEESPEAPNSSPDAAIAFPTRGQIALAACFATLFAIYGSLVPLNYQPKPLDSAIEKFRNTPFLQIDVNRRQDWVANILLYIPLGYLWASSLILDRRNVAVRSLLCVVTSLVLIGLAIGTEFLQIWFPPRTVSQNDIIAESIGAVTGCFLSLVTLQLLVNWFRQVIRLSSAQATLDWGLLLYLGVILLTTLMPFDFILNPEEFELKLRAGRISTQLPNLTPTTFANLVATTMMFLPTGLWAARWQGRASHTRTWLPLLFAACVPIILEIVQIPIFSRYATLTGAVAGVAGVILGFYGTRRHGKSIANYLLQTPKKNKFSTARTLCVLLTYLILLGYFYIGPIKTGVIGETVSRLQDFWQVPFARLYWGTELNAFFVVCRQLALLVPVGFMLGDLSLSCESPNQRMSRFVVSAVVITIISTLLEIGQVWNTDRFSDVTDAILLGFGGLAGLVVRPALLDFVECGFTDSDQRFVTLKRVAILILVGAIGLVSTATASYQTTHFVLSQSRSEERRVDLTVDRETVTDRFRIQNIIVPTTNFPEAIWGATGADSKGNIWFGVSDGREHLPSARVFKLDPAGGTLTEAGSILTELSRLGLLRNGESQSKVHSKFVEAEDGYLYFTSMDEKGEASDGSQLPIWGSHLWRIHPDKMEFEHLASVPEGLIAVSGGGRWIYSLGLFDHVLYQWDVREKTIRQLRVGSIGGHISRNFVTDHRGHAYVPRLRQTKPFLERSKNPSSQDSDVVVELVEFDTSLHEIGTTPLSNYLTESYWENHGIVGVTTLENGAILFATSRGYLYRILPSPSGNKSLVQALNWIHPDGPAYAPSLFSSEDANTVAGVVYRKDRFEWTEFDLRTHLSKSVPIQFPLLTKERKGVLLYGSETQDDFGGRYVVGRVYNTPVVLRIELLQ